MVHTTANHPWLSADHGWLIASFLHVGEPVRRADGRTATVVAVRSVPGAADMWDLTVSQVHDFAVGNGAFVVHNCGTSFANQLPDRLDQELGDANRLGYAPVTPDDPRFESYANEGRLKWAVTEDGELHVGPKFVNGEEVPHTALTNGRNVLAAGEADVAGTAGQYVGLDITSHSGHYMPSAESLEIGRNAFASYGILF